LPKDVEEEESFCRKLVVGLEESEAATFVWKPSPWEEKL
jgi:hypothetical protein